MRIKQQSVKVPATEVNASEQLKSDPLKNSSIRAEYQLLTSLEPLLQPSGDVR
ncbi:MAG TPA: hypothetical protein VH815_04375 [Acidobacteriota bacterium]